MNQQGRIILASASPRRKELLESLGLQVEIKPSHLPEITTERDYLKIPAELSAQKLKAVCHDLGGNFRGWVIAADTIVVLNNKVLGKPSDTQDAIQTLTLLSGQTHEVLTSFRVFDSRGGCKEQTIVTRVTFRHLRDSEIKRYVDTGETKDKAGSYAIQGGAAGFVSRVEGSYTNIVGLPLAEIITALYQLGAIHE